MAKRTSNRENTAPPLSPKVALLLREMAANPTILRYHANVLGGFFQDGDIVRLDEAYAELFKRDFIQPSGRFINFSGAPKRIYQIADEGRRAAGEAA